MFITHNMSVVKHISNDIVVMYLGQIVEKSPAKELFKLQLHPYTKALIAAIPVLKPGEPGEESILKGELSSPIEPKPGCRFASRCPYCLDKCLNQDPPLRVIGNDRLAACFRAEELN
jgi:peptide/nickel transport system ATP-binding protein